MPMSSTGSAALIDLKNRYMGPLASDPTTRPDGSALTAGCSYFNTTSNLFMVYNGTTFQASDINTANLAASTGATLVGHGTSTVAADLNALQAIAYDNASPSFPSVQTTPTGATHFAAPANHDVNLTGSGNAAIKVDIPYGFSHKPSTIGPDYGAAALTISSGTYTSSSGAISLTLTAPHTIVQGNTVRLSGLTGTGISPRLNGRYVAQSGTTGSTVVLTAATGLGDGTFSGGSVYASMLGGMAYRQPTESMVGNFMNYRMGGYNFEDDNASWIMQLMPNGGNIGSPNSTTATPKNTFEVGGGTSGNPNGFFANMVLGRDWARVQVAPDSSLMVQRSLFVGGVSAPYQTTTITSASYNSTTGQVTATLSADVGLSSYQNFSISGAAGTGSYTLLNGAQLTDAGTSGTTLNFTIATGLTMTITGGTVTGSPAVSLFADTNPSYLKKAGMGGAAFAASYSLEARTATGGAPVTSGTTQTNGIARLKADTSAAVMDMGVNGGSGGWVVATNSGALGTRYPIVLGDGGKVLVGASASFSPTSTLTVGGSLAKNSPTNVTSTPYTVQETDAHLIVNFAGTVTLALPSASSYPGRELTLRTIQAQQVISGSSNVVPITGGAASTAILAATAGKWALLVSDGANWQLQMAN